MYAVKLYSPEALWLTWISDHWTCLKLLFMILCRRPLTKIFFFSAPLRQASRTVTLGSRSALAADLSVSESSNTRKSLVLSKVSLTLIRVQRGRDAQDQLGATSIRVV